MTIPTPAALDAAESLATRHRPSTFRALGPNEPPERIEVGGVTYQREIIWKHDSWAATGLYVEVETTIDRDRSNTAPSPEPRRVVAKFNRIQPIGPLPTRWLGRRLAANEERLLRLMADWPGVPDWAGPVRVEGAPCLHAVARVFIPGRPLRRDDRVDDRFFPDLAATLAELHRRGAAYVDLHKRENILVGDDGRPYLIDFQISHAPRRAYWPMSRVLKRLQMSDWYHFDKHYARLRPDQFGKGPEAVAAARPWWIKLHRLVAQPFRRLRRRLLSCLKVRDASGRAHSEVFPEIAVMLERETAAARVAPGGDRPAPRGPDRMVETIGEAEPLTTASH